jgi:hypothetical protein
MDSYQAQVKDLSAKMDGKYSESNPPPPATMQAMSKCLSESVSIAKGAMTGG